MSEVQFTVIRNRRGPLSKSFTLVDGRLQKAAAADVTDGIAARRSAADICELSAAIDALTDHEALTFGIAKLDRARLVTQKAIAEGRAPKGAICRDRANFFWPVERTVLMLDIDKPKNGGKAITHKGFDDGMCELFPWWGGCARMYRPSASALIHDAATGEVLTGHGSLRCYAIADKGENIPHLGIALTDAFWKAGMGRIEFSASGALLLRTAIDGAVWQPERLDFAGPVVLGPGLAREKHASVVIPGGDIDTDAVIARGPGRLSFSAWSSNSLEVRIARHAARPEEKRRRESYIGERVRADVAAGEDEKQAQRKWRAAVTDHALTGNFMLYFRDRGPVTVAEVLSNPRIFDLERCADPHEPEYANDRRIAQFYANAGRARPHIFSHAHGGCKYVLVKQLGT